MSSTVKSLETH